MLGKIWRISKAYVIAIGVSFLSVGILIWILGYSPIEAFKTLTLKPFSSKFQIVSTFLKFVPLLLSTYAFAIPFTLKNFNIGASGQMLVGGTVVAVVGLAFENVNVSGWILVPLLLILAFISGGLFALIAGYLKVKFDINPVISTIMLNFVGFYIASFVATTPPWKAPLTGHPMTRELPKSALLPSIGELHIGLFIALAIAILIHYMMTRSVIGYEIEAVGHNPRAAELHGIDINKMILFTFFLGGAMAGLAGGIEVMGVHKRLLEGFTVTSGAEFGTFGSLTALMAEGNTIAIPIVAYLIAVLLNGADSMQRTMMLPVELVFLSQALMVILIVVLRSKFREG